MEFGDEDDPQYAPRYPIPARKLGALEHPLIIKDVDSGLRTFGPKPVLEAVSFLLAWDSEGKIGKD